MIRKTCQANHSQNKHSNTITILSSDNWKLHAPCAPSCAGASISDARQADSMKEHIQLEGEIRYAIRLAERTCAPVSPGAGCEYFFLYFGAV